VQISPAFTSYERVFTELQTELLELRHTLGVRNADAAELLTEMDRNLQIMRQNHRDWALKENSQEHNPDSALLGFIGDVTTLNTAKAMDDATAVASLKPAGRKWNDVAIFGHNNRHLTVEVRIISAEDQPLGEEIGRVHRVFCVSAGQLFLLAQEQNLLTPDKELPPDFYKDPNQFASKRRVTEHAFEFGAPKAGVAKMENLGVGQYVFWATAKSGAAIPLATEKYVNPRPEGRAPVELPIRLRPGSSQDSRTKSP
jgi:hypothetical protein